MPLIPSSSGGASLDPSVCLAWDDNVTVVADSLHNGFPGFVITADGTYVAGYTVQATHGANTASTYVIRSTDRGATWGAPVLVGDAAGTYGWGGTLTLLFDGRIAFSLARETNNTKTTSGAWVAFSADDGATWGDPIEVAHGFDDESVGGGQIVELADGTLLYPVWGKDAAETRWSVTLSKSTDGGATWDGEVAVLADGQSDGKNYNETGMAVTPDGTVVAVIRDETTPGHWITTSDDDGATWSAGASVGTSSTGFPQLIHDGTRLMFTYRNLAATGKTLAVALSIDNGTTWTLCTAVTPSPSTSGQMTYGAMAAEEVASHPGCNSDTDVGS